MIGIVLTIDMPLLQPLYNISSSSYYPCFMDEKTEVRKYEINLLKAT